MQSGKTLRQTKLTGTVVRRVPGWLLVLLLILILGLTAVSGLAQTQGDPDRGGDLYVENCALCHGVDGQGRIGASLENFPGVQIDATLRQTITAGIPGSVMPAWSQAEGGPLSEQDIDDIVAYVIAAFDGTEPIAPLPTYQPPPITALPDIEGDPSQGAVLFQADCVPCHGEEGQGRFGKPLAKEWASTEPQAYIRQVVFEGISGTVMPAWGQDEGGPYSDEDIADVTSFVLGLPPVGGSVAEPPEPEGPFGAGLTFAILALIAIVIFVGLVAYYRRA